MRSISSSLKDGAYLISQEPVMPNTTSNKNYIDKYGLIENKYGFSLRNGDRDDHFYREAEYIVAASFNQMDLIFYEDFVDADMVKQSVFNAKQTIDYMRKNGIKTTILKICDMMEKMKKSKNESKKTMQYYTREVKPKIMIFKKSREEYIPHLWSFLK